MSVGRRQVVLEAEPGEDLEFIIFGTPPMAMDDDRAKPKKV
jgi:hypothetical protein